MDAQETDAPRVYVVKAVDPAEQGHASVAVGIFSEAHLADEAVMRWGFESEDREKDLHGDRWRNFAISFYVEEFSVITSIADIPRGDTVYP